MRPVLAVWYYVDIALTLGSAVGEKSTSLLAMD